MWTWMTALLMQLLSFSVVVAESIKIELASVSQKATGNALLGETAHTWVSNNACRIMLFSKYKYRIQLRDRTGDLS